MKFNSKKTVGILTFQDPPTEGERRKAEMRRKDKEESEFFDFRDTPAEGKRWKVEN